MDPLFYTARLPLKRNSLEQTLSARSASQLREVEISSAKRPQNNISSAGRDQIPSASTAIGTFLRTNLGTQRESYSHAGSPLATLRAQILAEKRLRPLEVREQEAKLEIIKNVYTNDSVPEYANLARIDNVYGLFTCVRDRITYISLNNGPGDFDFYMHQKLSYNCDCLAMSYQKYRLWEIGGFLVNPASFIILSGDTGTSDIRVEDGAFLENFYRRYPRVEFALCSLPPDLTLKEELEFLRKNVEVAFRCLLGGRDAVLELPGSQMEEEEYALVEFCAQNFREIDIFKPVSSSLSSSRRYLICLGFLDKFEEFVAKEDIDGRLLRWLREKNRSIDLEIEKYYRNLLGLLRGENVELPRYNQTVLWAQCQLVK